MNTLTLISDWGYKDPYLALLKRDIYQKIDQPTLFDITHDIEILNINKAAFILGNIFHTFPAGTVHLVMVGVSYAMIEQPIVAKFRDHYFIGLDSGLFPIMFHESISEVEWRVYNGESKDLVSKMLDMAQLCLSGNWGACTAPYLSPKMLLPFKAQYIPFTKKILGLTMFIDAHHNIITNIPLEMFHSARTNSTSFRSQITSNLIITKYYDYYVDDVEPYFVANPLGVLEVAIFRARVDMLPSWQQDISIDIKFD